jgi:hypothetical protein
MENLWNDTDREKQTNSHKTCPSATLPTSNLILTKPESNPGLNDEKSATNYL